MDLKTTTRPNRHAEQFGAIRMLFAPPPGGRVLEVVEVGPGLAVKYIGRLAEESRRGWDIVKRIESGLRRIPMPDVCFENYETHELVHALGSLPFRLTVIDVNPRVTRVIARSMAGRRLETVVADLGEQRPPGLMTLYGRFDLVVAQEVVGRVSRDVRNNARANLVALARPGGVLLVDDDFADAGCDPVNGCEGFYRRAE